MRMCETINFTYDVLNRQTVKDIPSSTSLDVYSSYDLAGRPTSVRFASTSGDGIVMGDYDSAGRLTSQASYSHTLAYQYDANSNRTRLTFPDSNYFTYVYDALNRVTNIEENGATTGAGVLGTYTYDALGRRGTLTRGDGSTETLTYDNASRVTQLAQDLSGSTNDESFGFTLTAANQISQRTLSNDAFNWIAPSASRNYTVNGLNEYTNVGGSAFNSDARGNLVSDGGRNFQYDLENHLLQVSGAAALVLAYDPMGRLHTTTASSVTTEFFYDGNNLSAEYNGSTLLRRYVHGPGTDEPLTWYEGSGLTDRRYLIADNQGSIIAEDGSSVVRYTYGPYGEPGAEGWPGPRFRYTGQIALPEVSLYHYKARVYDPALGRFLQTDPVGYTDDLDLYNYVGNDPLNRADPSGLDWRNTVERWLGRQALKEAARVARERGIREAWRQERRLVQAGEEGTRRWSQAERRELARTGKVRGYEGHHRNTVNGNSLESAADPNNVEFLTPQEHADLHEAAGGTNQVIRDQSPLDRTAGGRVRQPVSNDSGVKFWSTVAGVAQAADTILNLTSLNPLDANDAQ